MRPRYKLGKINLPSLRQVRAALNKFEVGRYEVTDLKKQEAVWFLVQEAATCCDLCGYDIKVTKIVKKVGPEKPYLFQATNQGPVKTVPAEGNCTDPECMTFRKLVEEEIHGFRRNPKDFFCWQYEKGERS